MFCSCYQATNIYLPISWSLTPFVSFVRAPLPNLGFSLAGFTTFHSFVSKSIVTAAHYGINHIKDLDYLPPLAIATLGYFFPKHEHYNHHRLCEHGLSSNIKNISVCLYINCYYLCYYRIPFFQVEKDVLKYRH